MFGFPLPACLPPFPRHLLRCMCLIVGVILLIIARGRIFGPLITVLITGVAGLTLQQCSAGLLLRSLLVIFGLRAPLEALQSACMDLTCWNMQQRCRELVTININCTTLQTVPASQAQLQVCH